MQRSIERVLTTHTGSLPRPSGLPPRGADAEQLRGAVAAVVRSQVEAGIDVVNDGEASKPSYATYVTERLDGFGGTGRPLSPKDAEDFPEWAQKMFGDPALAEVLRNPACVGPIGYRDTAAVEADIANLNAATAGATVAERFLSAASPGVIALFLENQHYASEEEYLVALGEAMKTEYDAICRAGLVLQLDCPDLAMGWNVAVLGGTKEQFLREVARRVEVINHATRDIPPEQMRLHLCWGNYEGPHHRDVPLREILGEVLRARPAAISFEGANPRHEHEWTVFEDVQLPEGKIVIPGVIDSTTNYIEHPELVAQRIVRYAELVGKERVVAGTDCGFATFAAFVPIDPKIVWAKLTALAEGATLASQQLFA